MADDEDRIFSSEERPRWRQAVIFQILGPVSDRRWPVILVLYVLPGVSYVWKKGGEDGTADSCLGQSVTAGRSVRVL